MSSFVALRRLAQSFENAVDLEPGSRRSKSLLQATKALGPVVVPLCLRELASATPQRADLSQEILHALAEGGHRKRVIEDLEELLKVASATVKSRAFHLLAELGAGPLPAMPMLLESRTQTLDQFGEFIEDPHELASAAHRLLDSLSVDELLDLLSELSHENAASTQALRYEMLAHVELDLTTRVRLATAPFPETDSGRRRPKKTRCARGTHRDGHEILIAWSLPDRTPDSVSSCCSVTFLLGPDQSIVECGYAEDAGTHTERLVRPLRRKGFEFAPASSTTAAQSLLAAIGRLVESGAPIPVEYYLARHLFGITDEHLPPVLTLSALTPILADCAQNLIATERWADALPVLRQLANQRPDDSATQAQLGMCLLGLDDIAAAGVHLNQAATQTPDNPDFHWNLSAVLHRADNRSVCYLTLLAFCACATEADPRLDSAREFIQEFERIAALHHPGHSAREVAKADALVSEARALRQQKKLAPAMAMLERATESVPSLVAGWTELGHVELARRANARAQGCFERALALRPGDQAALEGHAQAVTRRRAAQQSRASRSSARPRR